MKSIRSSIKKLFGSYGISDELSSAKLREKFRALGVDVGLYSYGCFDLDRIPQGVSIGRYCSFARTAQIFLRNHGVEFLSTTPYLYNEALGVVDKTPLPPAKLNIGDDVWLGHNCIILSQVGEIGRGAIIAAGAVVTRPVPSYAIVAGNPAKIIKMRFEPHVIEAIEASRWWELDLAGLRKLIRDDPTLAFAPARYFANGPAEISEAPAQASEDSNATMEQSI